MEKKLYHISDELQALIDWDNVMSMPRYAGGHDEQMKGLFKGANVFESTLRRLCEVVVVKSCNDMKHSALAKIRYKI